VKGGEKGEGGKERNLAHPCIAAACARRCKFNKREGRRISISSRISGDVKGKKGSRSGLRCKARPFALGVVLPSKFASQERKKPWLCYNIKGRTRKAPSALKNDGLLGHSSCHGTETDDSYSGIDGVQVLNITEASKTSKKSLRGDNSFRGCAERGRPQLKRESAIYEDKNIESSFEDASVYW